MFPLDSPPYPQAGSHSHMLISYTFGIYLCIQCSVRIHRLIACYLLVAGPSKADIPRCLRLELLYPNLQHYYSIHVWPIYLYFIFQLFAHVYMHEGPPILMLPVTNEFV